jgi:hypothetical protein
MEVLVGLSDELGALLSFSCFLCVLLCVCCMWSGWVILCVCVRVHVCVRGDVLEQKELI